MKTKKTAGKITVIVNEHCQLPLPTEFLAASGRAVGDEYAYWKVSGGIKVVFPKQWPKGSLKIPPHAYRGRIGRWNNRKELIIQAKAAKVKKPKARRKNCTGKMR